MCAECVANTFEQFKNEVERIRKARKRKKTMGNWNMTVRGVGVHHNKQLPQDANRMFAAFVKSLKDAGHDVHAASFTYGAEDDIGNPDAYVQMRDVIEK